jgi:Na+-translocating ferredoxin:NAD+ oxidoreductase subunit A
VQPILQIIRTDCRIRYKYNRAGRPLYFLAQLKPHNIHHFINATFNCCAIAGIGTNDAAKLLKLRILFMSEYLLLILGTALVNNVVLVKFLGLCPFMGVSNKLDTALGMGMATTFVLTLASAASWVLEHHLLIPFDIGFLRVLGFILVIAAVVQFTEMVIHKTSPVLYQVLGIFLPLITTNCAVLGVALLNIQEKYNFIQSLLFGFGSALGFTLVMVLFAGLRERLAFMAVPALFAGTPIAFITAGILSLAFMGFAGLYSK